MADGITVDETLAGGAGDEADTSTETDDTLLSEDTAKTEDVAPEDKTTDDDKGEPDEETDDEDKTLLSDDDDTTSDKKEDEDDKDDDKSEDDDKDKDKKDDEGAPEKYEDFTMPEGVELDVKASDALKVVSKKHNLSQEAAQEIADIGAELVAGASAAMMNDLKEMRIAWKDETKAHPEFGGGNLKTNMALVKKGLDQFGTPELKGLLEKSGFGSHIEVLRMLANAGKAVSEDGIVQGGAPGATEKSIEDTLYDNPSGFKK